LIAVTEDVMHEYLANAMAERSKWTRDPLIMRRAIIAEYRASFWSSWAAPAGTYMARSSHCAATTGTTAYGRGFQEMYPAMPDAMRSLPTG
jgi:hypothetical protein